MTGTRVVGITGSNGKTSVKDLAAAVVGTRLQTHASPASFNNEVGLPMTLLGADRGVEVVVAEMGARREGDVRLLCDVARPDAVVVANVGTAHLEIFGSWDAIVRAGSEPVEWLGADGTAIVNADDPVARAYADKTDAALITFGLDPGADVRAEDVELGPDARATFTLWSAGEREPVELAVPGDHMVSNALAAAAVGRWAGVSSRNPRRRSRRGRRALADGDLHRNVGDRDRERRLQREPRVDGGRVEVSSLDGQGPASCRGARAHGRARAGQFEEHEKLGRLVVRIGVERLITVGAGANDRPRRDPRGAAARERRVVPGPVGGRRRRSGMGEARRRRTREGVPVAGLERAAEAEMRERVTTATRRAREADPYRRRGGPR